MRISNSSRVKTAVARQVGSLSTFSPSWCRVRMQGEVVTRSARWPGERRGALPVACRSRFRQKKLAERTRGPLRQEPTQRVKRSTERGLPPPPTNSTSPVWSRVADCCQRLTFMFDVGCHEFVVGSYSAAWPMASVTRTSPE